MKKMWWKYLGLVLVSYSIVAGFLVPLKPGINRLEPEAVQTGDTVQIRCYGYNSYYLKAEGDSIRLWLEIDSAHAVLANHIRVLSDTLLEAEFVLPEIPDKGAFLQLNAILDHPVDGVSLLPGAIELKRHPDTTRTNVRSWTTDPVAGLHVKQDFTYPYRNVLYESIRNTYFHVPMWFGLMFLFFGSVIYSFRYLLHPALRLDRMAAALAEVGLWFGFMGLATGMLWAHYAWGKAWSNDIKQLMTAVALLIYLAYFILRKSFDEPEKGARLAAVYNIFAFATLIPLLYIVPRMFASLHPGATGNPAFGSQDLDNTMRLVFYPAVLGWILIGIWMSQLLYRFKRLEDHLLEIDN